MSAEVPRPPLEQPLPRAQVVRSNRRQVILFAILTLILTVATVWGGRVGLRASETLTFAVGDPNSDEAHFAAHLSEVLKANASRLHLKIVTNTDNARALARFDRKRADLAILRTDAKVPSRARAIAILEHDIVLLLGPGNKKIKSLAELKKKEVAVLAEGDSSVIFVRNILDATDNPDAVARIQVTRIAPEKAGELATAILVIGEKTEHARSLDALEALQDELEAILRGAVMGLRDGTISTDGLETFKLGHEFVRDEIGMRRDYFKRHAGECEATDDNVVAVKPAQSA